MHRAVSHEKIPFRTAVRPASPFVVVVGVCVVSDVSDVSVPDENRSLHSAVPANPRLLARNPESALVHKCSQSLAKCAANVLMCI